MTNHSKAEFELERHISKIRKLFYAGLLSRKNNVVVRSHIAISRGGVRDGSKVYYHKNE